MFKGKQRTLSSILLLCFATLLGGCNFKLSIDGGGKVLMIHDDADLSKRSVKTCNNVCKDTSIDGTVTLEAVPDEGYTFVGYTATGIAPFARYDRYSTRVQYGLNFEDAGNVFPFINTSVTAIFRKTDEVLDVKESENYLCMLSKSEGLQCWSRHGNKKVQIDNEKVPQIDHIADQISVGNSHICAINNGEVNCWGGTKLNFSQIQNPTLIDSGTRIWNMQTCAIADSGITCWDDTGFLNNVPTNIINPREIQVGLGACAFADNGLNCWQGTDSTTLPQYSSAHGLQGNGERGCAMEGDSVRCWGEWAPLETTQPSNLMNLRQLAVMGKDACVLDDNGVQCWGENPDLHVVPPLSHPTKVEVVDAYEYFFCALDDNGTSCWGETDVRGNTYRGQAKNTPDNLVNPIQVVAGYLHTCALDDNGVTCWGGKDGHYNALVPSLTHPTQLSVSGDRTCALDGDDVVCWDYDGVTVDNQLSGISLLDIGGYSQNCAVNSTGLHCWGNVFYDDFYIALPNITKLTATDDFSCVITEHPPQPNALNCWYNKTLETIGPDMQLPWAVSSWNLPTSGATDIVSPSNNSHELCVFTGQDSECFGDRYVLEETNPKADELALGYDFQCKKLDGKTSCSGRGQGYKEGLYDRGQAAPPAGLTANAHSLTAGLYHACAIDQGKVVCWGEGPVTKLY